jgi:hypothetical protein
MVGVFWTLATVKIEESENVVISCRVVVKFESVFGPPIVSEASVWVAVEKFI